MCEPPLAARVAGTCLPREPLRGSLARSGTASCPPSPGPHPWEALSRVSPLGLLGSARLVLLEGVWRVLGSGAGVGPASFCAGGAGSARSRMFLPETLRGPQAGARHRMLGCWPHLGSQEARELPCRGHMGWRGRL